MTLRSCTVLALILGVAIPAMGDEWWKAPIPPKVTYQFGLLRKGPAWTAKRTPAIDSIQAGHLANINRMWEEGVLMAAGPLADGGDLRGVFIFRADSAAQVRALAGRDPAIQANRLVLDLYTWRAPPGIGEPYRRLSKQPGFRDSMITLQLGLVRPGSRSPRKAGPGMFVSWRRVDERLASGELATAGSFAGSFTVGSDIWGVVVSRSDSTAARAIVDLVAPADAIIEWHPWLSAYGNMPGDTLGFAR